MQFCSACSRGLNVNAVRKILKPRATRRYFDYMPEHAVTDKQFLNLYSQLPYDSHFAAIFDCCHSGGMTREGARKARGITHRTTSATAHCAGTQNCKCGKTAPTPAPIPRSQRKVTPAISAAAARATASDARSACAPWRRCNTTRHAKRSNATAPTCPSFSKPARRNS